jgi:PBP1b-binding outer membrane lipoprotein LpoB
MIHSSLARVLRISLMALLVLLTSCASYSVQRVSSSQLSATTGLDPRDVAEISAEMTESLLAANVLRRKGAGGRSVIALSTFRNNTSLYDFDPRLVFNRITVTLNRTGSAYSYVTGDRYVTANRGAVAHENQIREFLGEGKLSSGPSPQYTLTLELIEDHAQLGRTTQKAYQIHMTLNEIGSGLSVWEDLRDIVKVGRRSAVGF